MRSCSTLIFGAGLGAWRAPGAAEARVARFFVGRAGGWAMCRAWGPRVERMRRVGGHVGDRAREASRGMLILRWILDRRSVVVECVRQADASEPGPEIEIADTSAEAWRDPSRSAFPRKPRGGGRCRAMDNRARRAWACEMRARGGLTTALGEAQEGKVQQAYLRARRASPHRHTAPAVFGTLSLFVGTRTRNGSSGEPKGERVGGG